MSAAKLVVFFLRLISLGAVLFVMAFSATPLLIPEEIPDNMSGSLSPGCYTIAFLVLLLPISLIPACLAWFIQGRIVRPRQALEKGWRNAALMREERLGIWTLYIRNLILKNRLLSGAHNDPVPLLLNSEIPRALGELDQGRRERLLRFLSEASPYALNELDASCTDCVVDSGSIIPRRGLVSLASGLCALLCTFLLLVAGLMLLYLLFANPFEALAVPYGLPAQFVIGGSSLLIPALILGLASRGLRRMYRQALQTLTERDHDREAIQELAFKSARSHIESAIRWEEADGPEVDPFAKRIVRATVAITAPELDGPYRAMLVRTLYASGWLSKERRLSLEGIDLRAAELGEASLPEICLSGADLSGADLSDADLRKADLRGCILRGSDLRSALLAGANLRGADLRYARLQKARLEGADLCEVLLDGANFWAAGLAGTDLSGSRGTAEFLATSDEVIRESDK
jgi:uncharacterized protein YjbI with pentapeptide repeats